MGAEVENKENAVVEMTEVSKTAPVADGAVPREKSSETGENDKDPKDTDEVKGSKWAFWKRPAKKDAAQLEKVGLVELFRFATKFDRFLIGTAFVASVATGVAMPAMTIIFSDLVGSFGTGQTDDVNQNAMIMALMGIGMFVCAYCQMYFLMWAGENQARRIRETFFHSILRQDIGWFDNTSTGDLTTRMSGDTALVQEGISDKIGQMIQFTCCFIAGFVIAFVRGPKLAGVLCSAIPLLAASGYFMAKTISTASTKGQTSYARAGAIAEAVFSSMRTVAAFGGEKKEIVRYNKELEEAKKHGYKQGVIISIGVGALFFVIFSTYALAFWYGSRLVDKGEMKPNEVLNVFMAIMIGAFSLGNVSVPLSALGTAQGAAFKLYRIIDRKSLIDSQSTEGKKLDTVEGEIRFDNVDFVYPSRPDVPILKQFNLTIKPGQTVALVGSSGSGKSTIVKLIERFYDPVGGCVRLDGHDIRDLNVKWWRQQLGIVSQEPNLFSCSIRENLLYGLKEDWKNMKEEEIQSRIEKAAKAANVHDFIKSLSHGYDTLVGEAGSQLSGGQKQRIAIARAIMREPTILLLDEATSALDTHSERLVQAALDRASEGRTTIVIAHRLSTVKKADVIVCMQKGVIVETGTHTELVAKGGVYAELVKAQTVKTKDGEEVLFRDDENIVDTPIAENIKQELLEASLTRDMDAKKDTSIEIKNADEKPKDKQLTDEEREKLKKSRLADVPMDWMRLARMNQPEWPLLVVGSIAACARGCIMPVFSLLFSSMLAVLFKTGEDLRDGGDFWAGMFMVLAAVSFLSMFIQLICFIISGEKFTMRLRAAAFEKLIYQDISYFDNPDHNTGALTSHLAEDATSVRSLTGQLASNIISTIATFIAGITIALVYGWKLGLVVLSTVPLIFASGAITMKTLSGFGEKTKQRYEKTAQIANEAIENVRTVSTLTREMFFFNEYTQKNEEPHSISVRGFFYSSITFGLSQGIMFWAYALAFWYGAKLVVDGEYDAERVFKSMFAVISMAMSAGQMAGFAPDVSKAKIATMSLFEILDTPSRINASSDEGQKPAHELIHGEPAIEDVHFQYPQRADIKILQGLFVDAAAGKKVALVGPSGCGKSTVIQLLERFYDAASGSVYLDKVNVRDWNVKYMRQQMSLVGQEPVLFDTSIRDNITYGVEGIVTDEQIEAAARMANIHSFIISLPDGYNTRVGEKGSQLSGGQKQRIAIARALIRHPKLLLLDEATSALDSESEKVVQEALDAAAEGRTTIVIAHRLSTIQNADKIAVFKDGVVAEQGTHFDLLDKKGIYYELVTQQSLGTN